MAKSKKRDTTEKQTGSPAAQKAPTLYVKTLSGFELKWKGEKLFQESINRDTQFTRLLGVLLHRSDVGVDREMLREVLLEDSKTDDTAHMLRSVIYNTKQKLRTALGVEEDPIVFHKGKYYWTDSIPIEEDARVFEQLCEEAFADEDGEDRKEKYLKACYAYKGDFLTRQEHLNWANEEGHRYRNMFRRAVEITAGLLHDGENFRAMERLGRHASHAQPFTNWETIVLDAILSAGEFERAQEFYDATVSRYINELGVNPTNALIAETELLGLRAKNRYAGLAEISENLDQGELEHYRTDGGMVCIFPVFQGMYKLLERRGDPGCFLMLCSLVDAKGLPVYRKELLQEIMPRLEEAVCKSIRPSDAICRYSRNQYVVLFTGGTTKEACAALQPGITNEACRGRRAFTIEYDIMELGREGDS